MRQTAQNNILATEHPDLRPSGCSPPSPSGHPASPDTAMQEAAASEGPPGPSTAMTDSAALPAVRPQKLMFLELCCGSAGLSAAFRALGFQVLAVDHPGNRHVPLVHCVHLDLRLESSWGYLRRLVQARQVFLIHIAPPCGTASRARGTDQRAAISACPSHRGLPCGAARPFSLVAGQGRLC